MITTLDEVKALLEIPAGDASRDNIISRLIPIVEADYLRLRAKAFDTENSVIVYPENANYVAAMMISNKLDFARKSGVDAESLGDHSVTWSKLKVTGYPTEITSMIERFAKIR